jgi:hypothetical protein
MASLSVSVTLQLNHGAAQIAGRSRPYSSIKFGVEWLFHHVSWR